MFFCILQKTKMSYFLRIAAAACREMPIAARIVAVPTGIRFGVLPGTGEVPAGINDSLVRARAGVVSDGTMEAGTGSGSVEFASTLTCGWKQYFVTGAAPVTAGEYSQGVWEQRENPFPPHLSAAAVLSMHWQGAWHVTGVSVVVSTGLKQ